VSEEYLLAILARARGSKGGLVLVVLGVLILFAFLVFALVSVAGNVILMVTGSGPVVDFLDTGWGVLIGLIVAVVVILLGVAFLVRATPQPITEGSHAQVREVEQEREQAQTDKQTSQQEPDGDGLRRDWLKRECRDMAAYLRWFLKDHEHKTDDEIVDLYRERYQDKVAVLLQQLERQDLYPPEDRKSFQVAADKFPRSPMAIRNLAGTLGSIGQEI
jgi:hypothetical protein